MATSGKTAGRLLYFNLATQGAVAKDISAYVKSVDGLPGERDLGDVTTGGSTGYKYWPGLQKAAIKLECVFDDATDSAYDVVKNFLSDTAVRAFIYGPAGSTTGYAKLSGNLWLKKVNLPTKATEPAVIFSIEAEVDNGVTIGVF